MASDDICDSDYPTISDILKDWRQNVFVHFPAQTYLAWTTGLNSVFFGISNDNYSMITDYLRGIIHTLDNTSHDIITYDTYLQPLLDPGESSACILNRSRIILWTWLSALGFPETVEVQISACERLWKVAPADNCVIYWSSWAKSCDSMQIWEIHSY